MAGLASHGARVYMGARSESKATVSIQEIKEQIPAADVRFLELNLSNLASVVETARKFRT